jgi:hypothetical protein
VARLAAHLGRAEKEENPVSEDDPVCHKPDLLAAADLLPRPIRRQLSLPGTLTVLTGCQPIRLNMTDGAC